MHVIVVTNHKGGVGKTTVVTHLAAALAMLGKRVCIVDTDPQGHAAISLGIARENGLYTIMCDPDAQFGDVLRVVDPSRFADPDHDPAHDLVLLPGSKGTSVIPLEVQSPFKFRHMLEDLGDLLELDFIVVDTGPSNSMFDGSVHFAADAFIYVTQNAMLSFDGLQVAVEELNQINAENRRYRQRETQIMGIVPNLMRANTRNHRDNIALLNEQYPGLIWSPVMQRTIWETACDYGQTVFSYAPSDYEARDAWRLAAQALDRAGQDASLAWALTRGQPAKGQSGVDHAEA